jgi:PAS domain S-box-containing protein
MTDPKAHSQPASPRGPSLGMAGWREACEFLERIINGIGDPVFVKDGLLRFVLVNDAFCEIVGRARQDLLGRSDYEFFRKGEADAFWQRDKLVLDSGQDDLSEYSIAFAGRPARTTITRKTRFTDGTGAHFLVGVVRDVTRHRHAETALRVSEERHRLVFESSRDAILVLAPPLWRCISANPAALAMFGVASESDFSALGPRDVSPERQPNGQLSADTAANAIESALRNGTHSGEWVHRRLDGRLFSAEVLLSRMDLQGRSLIQATVRDVTERRQAEEALRASGQTFRSVIEASPLAIVAVDQEARVTLRNPAAERIFGWPAEEVLGRPYPLVPDEKLLEFESLVCAVFTGHKISNVNTRRLRKDGTLLDIVTSVAPLYDSHGEIVACMGMLTDVSEKTQLERIPPGIATIRKDPEAA